MGCLIAWGQHVAVDGAPPGNTVEALEYAYSLGFEGVEMDVRVSRDGVPFLLHDPTLENETDGHGKVKENDWSDLRLLSRGHWQGQEIRLSRLEDALVANGDRGIFLCDMRPRAPDALFDAILKTGSEPICSTSAPTIPSTPPRSDKRSHVQRCC